MENFLYPLIGLAGGFLIGISGMGGGAIITPLLILVGRLNPIQAVATDLAFAAITKSAGAGIHLKNKNVDFKILKKFLVGSIPGGLLGTFFLSGLLTSQGGETLVLRLLSIAIVISASVVIFKKKLLKSKEDLNFNFDKSIPAVAFMVGLLVSITSVGAGVLVSFFLLFFSKLSSHKIVGTDIVHGLILTVILSFFHHGMGTINWSVLGLLLLGSLPGVLLGSKLSFLLPEKFLRESLAMILAAIGFGILAT